MRALLPALFVLGGAGAAAAKAPPVPLAIGGVEVTGAQSDAVQPVITRAIRVGLRAPETGPDVPSCITADCLAAAGRAAGAQRVLAASIAVSGEFFDDYAIAITIADGQGRALRRRTDACKGCSVGEATDKITAMVGEIANAAQDDAVEVEIATVPRAGVPVAVDGTAQGPSPWKGTLPAGEHRAVAAGIDRTFFLEAGAPQRIELDVPVGPGRQPRFGPLLTYGTAAAGVGSIVAGAVLLARDGDPSCPSPGCPELHDTATAGWLFVGVGAAAVGAAAYFWWDDRRASRPVVLVAPTEGGAAAFASGRF